MVVAFHLIQPARGIIYPSLHSSAGAAGVDIFFVISGFIIYISQSAENRAAKDFIRRRLTRIVPLYWIYTILLILLHIFVHMNADLLLTPAHIIQSFFFVPHFDPGAPDRIQPVLVPGWTLQYEIFFYALFAVGVLILPNRRVLWMSVALVLLVAMGAAVLPKGAIGLSYTSPRLLEFLGGVLLGVTAQRWPERFPGWGWIGVPIGLGLLLATDFATPFWREAWGWGPAAALVVAGALCLDLHGRALKAPILKTLGDASYSIYLSHDITLAIVRQVWRLMVHATPNPLVFIAFSLIAFTTSAVVGVLVYRFIERPLLKRLNPFFAPRSTQTQGPPLGV